MRVICVDDERAALDNFASKVQKVEKIDSLNLFDNAKEALEWVRINVVDAAFLDIEMPEINGLELARELKKIDNNIRIVFMTAYDQYALDAFGVNALGYLLKPYTLEELHNEIEKAQLMCSKPKKRVEIKTMPNFVVYVDGRMLHFDREKPKELLALLVDRADAGITVREAIARLWPDRVNDESTRSLYRVTVKRLMDMLKNYEIDYIIRIEGRSKYLKKEMVECDMYQLLEDPKGKRDVYDGRYMNEYSWAEERNAGLNALLNRF